MSGGDFTFFGARLAPHQPGPWRWAAFTDAELYVLACNAGSMVGIGSDARRLVAEIDDEQLRRQMVAELDRRRSA